MMIYMTTAVAAFLLGLLPWIEFLTTEKWSMAAGASIDLLGKNGVKKYTPMFTVYFIS